MVARIHNNDVHHRKSALGIVVKKLSMPRIIVERIPMSSTAVGSNPAKNYN